MIESTPTLNVKRNIDFKNARAKNNTESFHRSSVTERFVFQIDRDGQECFVIIYNRHLKIDIIQKRIDVFSMTYIIFQHLRAVNINDSLSRGNDRSKTETLPRNTVLATTERKLHRRKFQVINDHRGNEIAYPYRVT